MALSVSGLLLYVASLVVDIAGPAACVLGCVLGRGVWYEGNTLLLHSAGPENIEHRR